MSRKELVLVVSRTLSLLLVAWALAEITYLPERLFSLSHHVSERSVLASEDYWTSYYLIITVFLVVRIIALFVAAFMFWKCGPRVQTLFFPQSGASETSKQITPNPPLER
jgi:hypothetical protein